MPPVLNSVAAYVLDCVPNNSRIDMMMHFAIDSIFWHESMFHAVTDLVLEEMNDISYIVPH